MKQLMTAPFRLEQLLETAAATPDRLALIEPKATSTYGELLSEARCVAATLLEAGLAPGEPVALYLEKSIEAVAALYGILIAGGCYVPIDLHAPPARSIKILARVGVRFMVVSSKTGARTTKGLLDAAPSDAASTALTHILSRQPIEEAPVKSLAWQDHGAAGELPIHAGATELDLAYVLHTSGSTGVPKGVAITHRNALAFVDSAIRGLGLRSDDRFACQAPLHFDLSVFDLFCAAALGAPVVLLPDYLSAFPRKVVKIVGAERVTVWNSVVSALALLLDKGSLGDAETPSLRLACFSGELMPPALLHRLVQALPKVELFNIYGQTEANSSLFHRVDTSRTSALEKLPLGFALPNFDVFLMDKDGRHVTEPDILGELCVRSPTVAAGYFRDPETTAHRFTDDPRPQAAPGRVYRTGDLARLDDVGQLWFAGRRDNLIKSRGYRIELDEVELALNDDEAVRAATVLPIPDPAIGHRLVAFVQLATPTATREEIVQRCKLRLPPYMIPEQMLFLQELPRTSTGKVDKKELLRSLNESGQTPPES